jgi:phenylacetate-CoA ligase
LNSATEGVARSAVTLVVSAIECTDHPLVTDCRYQVAWSINPHMKVGSVEFREARRQHEGFKDTLVNAGAEVIELPFVHGAFDSVFSKDNALLVERETSKQALLARLRHPERQVEQTARAAFYEAHGFEVVRETAGPTWEGGDVVMLPTGAAMFLGTGLRSRSEAAPWLEHHTGVPVVPIGLRDEHLYHLDMALTVLPDGTALVCQDALTEDGLQALERAEGITSVVTVRRDDALAFGLNLVPVGDTLVCGAYVPRVVAVCEAHGFPTVVAPLDQFHFAGGGAACLTARLHRDPKAHVRAAPRKGRQSSMDIYGPLFRHVLFPAWEGRVRRRPVVERWAGLERTQWLSADELHALQSAALQRLARHAYAHVPFYRGRMEKAGLHGDDFMIPEDLRRLPVLDTAELRANNKARESTAAPFPTLRKQTSGTTGEPLVFSYEPDSEHWRQAVKLRGYEWAGYRPGDRVLYFWGAPLPTDPLLATRAKIAVDRYFKRETYMQCAVLGEDHLRAVVKHIERKRPRVLVCYAQAGAELARFVNRNGLRTWSTIPVISGAERLLPRDRTDMEEAFGPAIFDTYGCREAMLIAAECEAHDGLHVSMENLIVEILVDEDGKPRPAREGESGRVVFTDLHNLGMPFIRYANGDIATAGPTRRCSCGRTLARIQSVQGRTSELLRDANGTAVSGLALSFLFHDIAAAVRQFQAVQHKDRSVTINLVLNEALSASALGDVQRNGERLLSGVDVRIQTVADLPRNPAGKHRLVVIEHD